MRKNITILSILCFWAYASTFAQVENAAIARGNKLYKEGQFEKAIEAYEQALKQNPENTIARYNLAAARFRSGKFEDAQKVYNEVLEKSNDDALKQKAAYNSGVAFTKQNKLWESIEAYKLALRMNPLDADARFNLQKALEELRRQQKKSPENKQDQKKEKKQEPQKQPPASKKQIEQWLQSLRQKEQEVQNKMQQNRSRSASKPEKDW